CPPAVPRDEWQRCEQDGVEDVSRGVELQLGCRGRASRGQAGPPLVIVRRVERADDALNREQPQRDRHRSTSSRVSVPSYAITRPIGFIATSTVTSMPPMPPP